MTWFDPIKDVFLFLVEERKFFIAPLVIIITLMAIFILVAEVPVLTPFIYALF